HHLRGGRGVERRPGLDQAGVFGPAGRATGQVPLDGRGLRRAQVAVNQKRQLLAYRGAGHVSSRLGPKAASRSRSRPRAAAKRDLSVLAGTPSTRAISSKLIPSSWRSARTSRSAGGNAATARPTTPASSRCSQKTSGGS